MDILKATTEAEARALADKAFAYAVANQRAKGAEWSEVKTDGKDFAITWDANVAAAFTAAELGTTKAGEVSTNTKVVAGTVAVGTKKTGEWEPKLAPVADPGTKLLTK